MLLLYSLTLINSILFLFVSHPLSLGMILIIQTITISSMMGMISQTFWFSYILFLVIIGGMMILFIYVISLIFNKMFTQKIKMSVFLTTIPIVSIIIYHMSTPLLNNSEMTLNLLSMEYSLNILKLYNFPANLINLMMINYLFFLLVVVVKITSFKMGPLRMKI